MGEYDDLLGRGEYREPTRDELLAQVKALTAERDDLQGKNGVSEWMYNRTLAERDAARAELAAANARCAELEAALPKRTNDWLAHCKRLDAERDAVSDDLCKAWKELGEVEAENAALQATLDRVTALADEWDTEHETGDPVCDACKIMDGLRAALTPEGKPEGGCGECLTCAPTHLDRGLPTFPRMYVCATCGNKRCPAAADCRKWKCSGSNATDQIPVPK